MNPAEQKIIIIAYWHDPRFRKKAGGLIRMYELADNLTDLGHHVKLVLPDLGFPQQQTHAEVVKIPLLDIPFLRPVSFHILSTLYLLYACSNHVKILYVRQMNSFLPLVVARLYGVCSVFEIPNDPYLGYDLVIKYKRCLFRGIDRLCMHLCSHIIVLSEWSKRRLHAREKIAVDKILVSPSGTDTTLFHPLEKKAACLKLGFDPSYRYVGFTGTFLSHQGVEKLIEAAPAIIRKIPKIKFVLVGDGPMRSSWEKAVQDKDLEDYFHFEGYVPYRSVPDYIGVMDVCVAPHHYGTNQASPVKIFDYMASGRPIVATDIDVVREIIAGSGCAILTDPHSMEDFACGVITLLENVPMSEHMGVKGRLFAQEHYDRKKLTGKLFCRVFLSLGDRKCDGQLMY